MIKFRLLLTVFFAALLAISCDINDDGVTVIDNPSNGFSDHFGSKVSRDFIGQIVDTNKDPIQNAAVTIGNKTVQTDINGVFIINSAEVYEKFAHIKAVKAGFIKGSRSMVPTSGKNNVRIMMLPNTPVQTIQSGVESEVDLPNGTTVKFDGAFKDESGTAYTGFVEVSMFHLTPSDENLSSLMPGMLYAEDQNGDEKVLETFGMLNVELKGNAGQKLQIATGHTAEISVEIDASQLATAANTIPLWHFDEVNGYWKQEGSATKQGNKYVGNVSHFSWWNCDQFSASVLLQLHFVNANTIPLPYVQAGIVRANGTHSMGQISDNNGWMAGLVPANEALQVCIVDLCGNYHYYPLGILTINTTSTITVIPSGSQQFTTVSGTLFNCNNTIMINGYVMYEYGNNYSFAPVTNGSFSFAAMFCNPNTSFMLEGIDYDNLQSTGDINYNFSVPNTNVGNLITCNTIDEFITYQIDNNSISFAASNLSASITNGNSLYINGSNPNTGGIIIYGSAITPGIYTTSQLSIEGNSIYIHQQMTNSVIFNLSSLGAVGQYVDMTFNGPYTDSNGVAHTINGTVHVKRDN